VLAADKDRADYFEAVIEGRDAKLAANWVNNELFGRLNKESLSFTESPVSPTSSAASWT
jgi:aspartyl-tRNA(Asn)/glutamyl-tRNA(Gln) amidotransferase subunit B